ncbi:MAG: acyltransferase domain-containing protein, partial [Hyphomonadaceae bacterium]|nr:acyltransferase domain-containing protein [Hyphomonadaceae bacterium]
MSSSTPIAIVGIGGIFPGRGDVTGFWRDLFEGRDLLTPVPASHWLVEDYYDDNPRTPDKTYGKRGGFLSPLAFDPLAFGISPKAMEATDSAQLLALVAARRVLEDIERDSAGKIDKARTSVILGVASATELTAHMAGRLQRPVWVNALREAGLPEGEVQDIAARMDGHYSQWQEATFPGLLGNVVAGRIANRLDLGGSNYVTDAACASSLSALQIALHELRAGDSDTVLTGGVDALNDILMYMCFSKTPALSPTGDCRPFSADADGTMLGEAVGMLALRRLEDAERDGNTIHAVIRGLGGASDGAGTAIYSPRPGGQARALSRAYEQAGYGPETVDLVEAHGTGTKAGDKAELDSLHMVFGEVAAEAPWCALGSVKSQIGHTKAAAGAASLIKTVQALSRKILPATLKVEEPAEVVRESTAFYLNTEARPWIAPKSRPRRAAVSSFGFGGSNFHVTLEEYTGKRAVKPYRVLPAELFLFSGSDAGAVANAIEAQAAGLTEADMPSAASASHAAFKVSDTVRVSLLAETLEDFTSKAADMAARLRKGALTGPFKPGCHAATGPAREGKVAFMFAGQGSQYVGMGADLAMAFPEARAVWDRAAGHKHVGPLRLDKLSFPPAAFDQVEFSQSTERLTQMQHAQPAIAAVALSQLALANQLGLKPDMAAGHSFGEIMALYSAGVMKEAAALTIAAQRGALMAEAARATEGKMLALQADAGTVQPILDQVGKGLVLANDNAPDQVVLSGPAKLVEAAEAEAKQRGLKARFLPVATAFHSEIVAGAVEPFQAVIEGEKL